MNGRRVVMWGTALGAGVLVVAAAGFVHQVRRQPVTDSEYVALGSSYAAGLGLGPRAPGSPIVSQRSVNGYPQQLARLLAVPSFTDMTSSGSTVRHVLRGGQMGLGPQIAALGPDTRLVTLTAGGNDVGYVGDLVMMAYRNRGGMVGRAVGLVWKGARPAADRDFASLHDTLVATLREIRRRSPRARIVVATYPAILPARGTCARLGIDDKQADIMRQVGDRLAATTRAAAAEAGAILVDMASLSEGHDACGAQPWVNGAAPATGAVFHPTLAGARATAQAIADALARQDDAAPRGAGGPDDPLSPTGAPGRNPGSPPG